MENKSLVQALTETIHAKGDKLTQEDNAAITLAYKYAHYIDTRLTEGEPYAAKAVFLGPHLLNILKELGCTPASSGRLTTEEPTPITEQIDELAQLRKRRRG